MESWKRRLRMGMVGGGQGAFIGGVHLRGMRFVTRAGESAKNGSVWLKV